MCKRIIGAKRCIIKHFAKITDHKNNMEGFENGIKHQKNLGAKIADKSDCRKTRDLNSKFLC